MANDSVRMQSLGIKCDTEGCDFKVSFGEREVYTSYLNKPCPVCSANLLTQQDYDTMMQMLDLVELSNNPEVMKKMEEQLPQEIKEMIAKLENPDVQAKLKVDFVDGIPVMSSEDPEIQGFIDEITEFYTKQGE